MLCQTLFVFLHCVAGNVFYQYGQNDLPCFVFSKKRLTKHLSFPMVRDRNMLTILPLQNGGNKQKITISPVCIFRPFVVPLHVI